MRTEQSDGFGRLLDRSSWILFFITSTALPCAPSNAQDFDRRSSLGAGCATAGESDLRQYRAMMAETDPFPLISAFVIQLPFIDQIKPSLLADGWYSNLDSFAFSRCSRRFLKGSEPGGVGDAFSSLVCGGGCSGSG